MLFKYPPRPKKIKLFGVKQIILRKNKIESDESKILLFFTGGNLKVGEH